MYRTVVENIHLFEIFNGNMKSKNGRNLKRSCSPSATPEDNSSPKPAQEDI